MAGKRNESLVDKFRQFMDSTNTAVKRAVQRTDEALGNTDRTLYDPDTIRLIENAEELHSLCEKLRSGLQSWMIPNPADRFQEKITMQFDVQKYSRPTTSSVFGKKLYEAAEYLNNGDFGGIVAGYGAAMVEIGKAEQKTNAIIEEGLFGTIQSFLSDLWPEIQRERKLLDSARLDFDLARRRLSMATLAELRDNEEVQVQEMRQLLDSQLYRCRLVLGRVAAVQEKIREGFLRMAEIQSEQYHLSYKVMQNVVAYLKIPQESPDEKNKPL